MRVLSMPFSLPLPIYPLILPSSSSSLFLYIVICQRVYALFYCLFLCTWHPIKTHYTQQGIVTHLTINALNNTIATCSIISTIDLALDNNDVSLKGKMREKWSMKHRCDIHSYAYWICVFDDTHYCDAYTKDAYNLFA